MRSLSDTSHEHHELIEPHVDRLPELAEMIGHVTPEVFSMVGQPVDQPVVSILARFSSSDWNGQSPRRHHEATDMKFSPNESPTDRIIRIVAGLGLAGLALTGAVTAPVLYLVWAVAAIALVTGIVGFCPLYALFHVGTRRAAR